MRRAILTGATGAVGTALIQELVSHGVEVLVLANPGSKRNDAIPNHPLVTVKPCSLDDLAAAENDTGKEYDVFYHFAWAGTTGAARNDMYLQNRNVCYALDAVAAAKRFGCKRFIGAGSQAEYGPTDDVLRPDTPVFPVNGYGMAKLCAGQMSRAEAHRLGLEHVWVRILSVYGPRDGAQSLVMSVINDLRQGTVPRCTKGEQIWDYLYSGDAARAFRLVGEKGVDGKTYVLGSGQIRTLAEYIRTIRVAPDSDVAFGALPYPPGQVMRLQADTSELENDTGWRAEIDFRAGIRNILERG